ncbi:hypothetical protein D3C72_2114710 [compost metagenome]
MLSLKRQHHLTVTLMLQGVVNVAQQFAPAAASQPACPLRVVVQRRQGRSRADHVAGGEIRHQYRATEQLSQGGGQGLQRVARQHVA